MEPKVYYRLQKSQPLDNILIELSPARTHTPYFVRSILILSSHLSLSFQSGLFLSGFPTEIFSVFMFRPSYPPSFDYPNNIWRSV
jgi:hypothetical protein